MIPVLSLTLAVLVADPGASEAPASLAPRLAPASPVQGSVDLRLDPTPRELRPPAVRRASMLRSAAGFLLGDALALGVLGGGWFVTDRFLRTEGDSGMSFVPVLLYTGIAALVAPPMLGTWLGAGARAGVPGTAAALLFGGAAHVAALVAALRLADRGHGWLAGGLVAGVDLVAAPFLVTWCIERARAPEDGEDAIRRAHPVPDPATARR